MCTLFIVACFEITKDQKEPKQLSIAADQIKLWDIRTLEYCDVAVKMFEENLYVLKIWQGYDVK